jgi:hypothetical protein
MLEAGDSGNGAVTEAWNQFGSDLASFQEAAAALRAEDAPDTLGRIGGWQPFELREAWLLEKGFWRPRQPPPSR